MGYVSFFENFVQIAVLLFAWIVVLLAFFILAIQLFVTLIEFKLTTLAGFVLIPFGLFGKTAFAAERVLGNVISSGIKVLVLAVIVGIGSTLFSQFTAGFGGNQPTIEDAMALVLAALSLLGPWHFRTRHRQRHRLRRTATRRRRRRRHRPWLLAASLRQAPASPPVALASPVARSQVLRAVGQPPCRRRIRSLPKRRTCRRREAGASAVMSPLRRLRLHSRSNGQAVSRPRALQRMATGLGAAHEARADH